MPCATTLKRLASWSSSKACRGFSFSCSGCRKLQGRQVSCTSGCRLRCFASCSKRALASSKVSVCRCTSSSVRGRYTRGSVPRHPYSSECLKCAPLPPDLLPLLRSCVQLRQPLCANERNHWEAAGAFCQGRLAQVPKAREHKLLRQRPDRASEFQVPEHAVHYLPVTLQLLAMARLCVQEAQLLRRLLQLFAAQRLRLLQVPCEVLELLAPWCAAAAARWRRRGSCGHSPGRGW